MKVGPSCVLFVRVPERWDVTILSSLASAELLQNQLLCGKH